MQWLGASPRPRHTFCSRPGRRRIPSHRCFQTGIERFAFHVHNRPAAQDERGTSEMTLTSTVKAQLRNTAFPIYLLSPCIRLLLELRLRGVPKGMSPSRQPREFVDRLRP